MFAYRLSLAYQYYAVLACLYEILRSPRVLSYNMDDYYI